MKFPRLVSLLISTALAAWLAGALYTWFVDPELKFWASAARQKLDWVDKMREKHGYVIGVVGGSTTTFGIDAEYMEKAHGLPVANLGLHFGMGPACIGFGLSALREGDVLVLSLEPAMLTAEDVSITPLGSKLASLLGRPDINSWVDGRPLLTAVQNLGYLRPGGYQAATMIGKLALGKPLYRYSIDNLQPGGLQVTRDKLAASFNIELALEPVGLALSSAGKELLRQAKSEAAKRGLELFFLMPVAYCPPEEAEQRRTANEQLLRNISKTVAVLWEPSLGVSETIEDFSDSWQHLTPEAARMRSRLFAKTLLDPKKFGDKPNP